MHGCMHVLSDWRVRGRHIHGNSPPPLPPPLLLLTYAYILYNPFCPDQLAIVPVWPWYVCANKQTPAPLKNHPPCGWEWRGLPECVEPCDAELCDGVQNQNTSSDEIIKGKALFPQIWRKNACQKWRDTTSLCFKATERARNIKADAHAVVLFFNLTLFKELFRIMACKMGSGFYKLLFNLPLPFAAFSFSFFGWKIVCDVFFFLPTLHIFSLQPNAVN